MGGGKTEAPDVVGAAREEGYQSRLNAQAELLANRPDQYGPKGSTTWERVAIDPNTGLPYDQSIQNTGWDHDLGRAAGGYIAPGDLQYEWTQNTQLNDQYQGLLDNEIASAEDAQKYRNDQAKSWYYNPTDFQTSLPGNTISRGDLDQFGQNSSITGSEDWREFGAVNSTLGQDDWRQFGTTDSTIGRDDWRQFASAEGTIDKDQWQDIGAANPTLGAGDWRQFGDTERTLNSGDYDARYGNQDHGFGDHEMGGGDWDLINYSPEHIRTQAAQQTQDYMNSQLDPQWATKRESLEVQLANQGLQWGDAAYDNAMSSFEKSKSNAYSGARNQSLADSRAEAMMLWDQEMGRSEQKNKYTQADLDNDYRARQSNISNYLQETGQDQSMYLQYQQAAFDQDRLARQQQLDSNLGYSREAFGQDYQSRQQALDAQLNYGRENWQQDFQTRQQDLNANLDYGRESYQQDFQTRQQQLESDLAYGRESWNQDFQTRQQNLDANRLYDQQAFDQDLQARQSNISNYLNFGQNEFQQGMSREEMALQQKIAEEQAQQGRYGLVNPADNLANMEAITA